MAQWQHNMERLNAEDKKRFAELFAKLDVNKDGKIEASELASALSSSHGVKDGDKHAKVIRLPVLWMLDFYNQLHW